MGSSSRASYSFQTYSETGSHRMAHRAETKKQFHNESCVILTFASLEDKLREESAFAAEKQILRLRPQNDG